MLHSLYYLFNNNLELDSYIAIEAISEMAEDEILVDVMLMCNSIKNLIQQNKSEPSIQNALSKSNQTNVTANSKGNPVLKTNRSGSIISNKKKTTQDSPSQVTHSSSSNPISSQVSNLKKADSNLESNSTNSGSSSPQSYTHNFLKSNDLVLPVAAEVKTETKLVATNKMQKQQTLESLSQCNNFQLPPPIPTSPLPLSESEINFAISSKEIALRSLQIFKFCFNLYFSFKTKKFQQLTRIMST